MRPTRQGAAVLGAIALSLAGAGNLASADWPQWGGPTRDFQVETSVVPRWPPGGPRVGWQRPLDEGYSGIVVADGTLYTLGRRGDMERVFAMSAETGEALWTYEYSAPLPAGLLTNHGVGPRSTPLVAGTGLITVGINGTLLCLDRTRGTVRWRVELVTGLGGSQNSRGYASSPLAFGDLILVPVGGKGRALVAFRLSDGTVAWKSGDFESAPSSPLLIELGSVAWRDRSFGRLNLVKVGDLALVLDEKGSLGLVTLSPEGLKVHARVQLREETTWTGPSVSGRRAYIRTKTELIALELPYLPSLTSSWYL